MALFAFAIAGFLGLAIFSFSRQAVLENQEAPRLQPLELQLNHRRVAPEFKVLSAEGKVLSLDSIKGLPTLLTFWSITCPPCLVELPLLNAFAQNWSGPELQVIIVNVDGSDSEQGKRFLTEQGLSLRAVFDTEGVAKRAFGVNAIPHHVLIDRQGSVVWESTGAYDWSADETSEQLIKWVDGQGPQAESPESEESK
jgi:cytochrome c biogenesis protein CcmG, thiol:disulfide interchange protein DsbE